MGNVLVKLHRDGEFVTLTTYERGFGRQGRFFFKASDFAKLTTEVNYCFWDSDCGNTAHVVDRGTYADVTIWWMSMCTSRKFAGFKQDLRIPICKIAHVICDDEDITLITNPDKYVNPVLDFFHAQRTLSNIISNKQDRRALSKFLRDNFHWSGDKITLYNDGNFDFYFVCSGAWSVEGGVIMHNGVKATRDGAHEYVYFGIHT